MAIVRISSDVNDLTFGDYVVEVKVSKATPTGPVEVAKKSANFAVPGAPAPAPSMSISVDTNA